jgi:hypothetical protein
LLAAELRRVVANVPDALNHHALAIEPDGESEGPHADRQPVYGKKACARPRANSLGIAWSFFRVVAIALAVRSEQRRCRSGCTAARTLSLAVKAHSAGTRFVVASTGRLEIVGKASCRGANPAVAVAGARSLGQHGRAKGCGAWSARKAAIARDFPLRSAASVRPARQRLGCTW